MFNPFKREDPLLEEAITNNFIAMKNLTPGTDNHTKIVEQQTKLYALKSQRVDVNTLLTIGGNIVIGLAVLNYEKTGVVTSKARDFFTKK